MKRYIYGRGVMFVLGFWLFGGGQAVAAGACPGGGCGGSAGAGGLGSLTAGFASTSVERRQTDSQAARAVVNAGGEVEANIEGFWFRVNDRAGWSSSKAYESDGSGNVTKVTITVTDPTGRQYKFRQTGSWSSADEAWAETYQADATGNVKLREVYNGGAEDPNVGFAYDGSGRLVTQYSFVYVGDPPQQQTTAYLIYGYDGGGNLNRLWAGTDPDDYAARGTTPSGGRWIDLDFDAAGMLTFVTRGCDSCGGGGARYYTYTPAQINDDPGYLLTAVKGYDQRVLFKYAYDELDRYTQYWLGDGDLKVTEWIYTDYAYDENTGEYTGSNTLLRCDYVDNTTFRATMYLADDSDSLQEVRYYLEEQTDPAALTGPYARRQYTYERDDTNRVTRVITTHPAGNKSYALYDTTGALTQRQISTPEGDPITLARYTYTSSGDSTHGFKRFLTESIDVPREATTSYDYNDVGSGDVKDKQLTKRTDPAITGSAATLYGAAHAARQTTNYAYDGQGRLTLEWSKDANLTQVSTKYLYDSYGNLATQIVTAGETDLSTTCYEYDVYQELTKTYVLADGVATNVQTTLYTGSGQVLAEAVLAGSDAVSEKRYEYDADGWLTRVRVALADEPFTLGSPPAWADTVYQYDAYGRRTAVIVDPSGENLTTTYEYNNQSEVVRVTGPDQRYRRTERDGRGLVVRKITGLRSGVPGSYTYTDKATTQFFYDLNGNLTRRVDPEGITEVYRYDGFGRMTRSRRGR